MTICPSVTLVREPEGQPFSASPELIQSRLFAGAQAQAMGNKT